MKTEKDILEHIRAKQKPTVDPAYFEQFHANMLEKIKTQSKPKVVYLRPAFWLSTAAAVALLVFGINFFNREEQTNFASVSKEEIENYLDEHPEESVWEVVDEAEEPTEKTIPLAQNQEPREEKTVDKTIEIASMEGFVGSAQLLDELSTDDLYQYIESEEFDLEELDYSQF